jgi:polyferredoxin
MARTENPSYHWKRRATQLTTLALLVVIPVTGMFRIDLVTGNFLIFTRRTCWADFFLMFGSLTMLGAGAVLSYATIGRVWCGWCCPQNTFSEWADNLTRRWLGRHASVDLGREWLKVAVARNKPLNWVLLGASFLGVSLVLAVIPFFYFYPAEDVLSLVLFRPGSRLSWFMHVLYFVAVLATFLYIAVIRHTWCSLACPYRFGQYIFKSRRALRVEYDAARAADCERCNYCASSCVIGIEPTNPKAVSTGCINCGECIEACDRMHEKRRVPGLLRFEFGTAARAPGLKRPVVELISALGWAGPVFALGCVLFAWGLLRATPVCWR